MEFDLKFEGRSARLPISGKFVETGDTFTATKEQVTMLADGGYLVGPRSPYQPVDPEHTRDVVVAHKDLTIYDENDELREYGDVFQASDGWLLERYRLVINGRFAEAGTVEIEVDEPEGDQGDDDPPAELDTQSRIEQALEGDNFNQMRSVLAAASEESTGGMNKAEIRTKLERLLEEG